MPSETGLIDLFARAAGAARDDVVIGIGDDAAVLRPAPGQELVACTDTLVEGVHFAAGVDPVSLGHKALAVNLSDLAAMGADPAWALLSLTLPHADEGWVVGFATGFTDLAARFGVMLVGGDTGRGALSVTVQALGQVPVGMAIGRNGARPGDGLYVTGPLGDAALALRLGRAAAAVPMELRARLDRPEPRIGSGLALRGQAHAAIDLSDGLSTDLARLAAASGVGATIEAGALPASGVFLESGGTEEMQLDGGDDYELLYACPGEPPAGAGAFRVGTVEADPGLRLVRADGTTVPLEPRGYEHFGS